MLVEFGLFSFLILTSLLLPIIVMITLLMLGMGEKEVDVLQLENTRIRLEKELQQSEYMQLSQQIHPHFLFNTLNAFMSLARLGRNNDMVRGMERFSLFLRYNYQTKESLVPFHEEWEHTQNYLFIQQIRFGKKLEIHTELDQGGLSCLIPPYTLQTLVENAFKHGLEKRPGEKRLRIFLSREGNWMHLMVEDNGNENQAIIQEETGGIGLKNLRKRLQLLFDLRTSIILRKNKQNHTEVLVVWPYTPEDE